jgi:YVTN family beta-propeller protein
MRSKAAILVLALMSGGAVPTSAEEPATFEPERRWREPVALVPSSNGAWLYVANRESGTVSVIEVNRAEVVAETKVGESLADLESIPGGDFLLAVDEGSGRLKFLRPEGPRVEEVGGVEVGQSPVGLGVDPTGGLVFVSLLWPRKLAVVEVSWGPVGPEVTLAGSIELPFEPRCLAAIGRGKVVVADAFGGGLAVVDGPTRRV